MIKGIIFDLDGTLIDSMQVWYDVDRRFLRENGICDPPDDISDRIKKMTIDQSSELFIREFGLKCSKEYVIQRIEELVRLEYDENIPLKPFVPELLNFLDSRGIPCGVATVTYRSLAEAVLRRCGIRNRFKFLLTDVDFPDGKNSPDIYMKAAELLRTKPEETLVAEDSLHCVETAANAGFITAAVYDRAAAADRAALEKLADFYIMKLDEVKDLV